jgi:SAM-dependent methyltransferase
MKKIYGLCTLFLVPMGLFAGCCGGRSGCCSGKNCCPKKDIDTKANIKEVYDNVAKSGESCSFGGKSCGCRAKVSQDIGYTREELDALADANLGLGCGHPISLGDIKEGNTIVDLGSGAGLDCFLAARKVGKTGKVIGIDVSEEMLKKATANAAKYGYTNVEFRLGDIENMPVKNNVADIIISNCVLSLAVDKAVAFKEAYRVLKSGGKMYVSDIVLLDALTDQQKNDANLRGTCALSAIDKTDYLNKLVATGFEVEIVDEDLNVNKTKYNNATLPISSLKYIAHKK